ncbi:hypothetical protein KJ966_14990 [bacterium]|nr:hypothetical protein [bacterium]
MKDRISKFLFDRRDYELLQIVSDVLKQDRTRQYARQTYNPLFHPNGIKELAESKGLRIAYAVVSLVSSLQGQDADRRISALRALRHEIIDTAPGTMPKNTARVLLEIMKELVRSHENVRRQLELAHDFRITATGKPHEVRQQLKNYHLLEMPEEWNQIAFDDHVHDVNTKGRKSSTHLIMDAWIKGIRRLRVIHYNYIAPSFASELLAASEIMGIDIRIGIEFPVRFRNKYIQLIWVPRGFTSAQDFMCFLQEERVQIVMEKGRKVSDFQQAHIMDLFAEFNRIHLKRIGDDLGIELLPLDEKAFLDFVGIGQKSKLHLSKFIHSHILKAVHLHFKKEQDQFDPKTSATNPAQGVINHIPGNINIEKQIKHCMTPEQNSGLIDPDQVYDPDHVPEFLRLSPIELLDKLIPLRSGYRFTLNLTHLDASDVLEIIYDCEGAITRLEIFNLKDYAAGLTNDLANISELQAAINKKNVIILKRVIHSIIDNLAESHHVDREDRIRKLTVVLHDIERLVLLYRNRSLKARIGSDSTGRSPKAHGMGLALIETLPYRAQRQIGRRTGPTRDIIPITMAAFRQLTFIPKRNYGYFLKFLNRITQRLGILQGIGHKRVLGWKVQDTSIRMQTPGNIVTLGGVQKNGPNHLELSPVIDPKTKKRLSWRYLNTRLKNSLKVLIGFIPAFATFSLTKDWWLLAYGGAFIWFAITGLRNIWQSVLGGGGLRRSPLLRWNDYVSWDRLTDSLMYTGFSVPLLDYLVKTVILDHMFDITTTTHPILLYSFMALANGIYLSSHNAIRGLPRTAVAGNFFRSVISIPVAIIFNTIAGFFMATAGIGGIDNILQKWAAVISKAASDLVAAFIEGLGDRIDNIRLRFRDYRHKLADLIDVYAQLEVMFPEVQTTEILNQPCRSSEKTKTEVSDLEQIIMVHALDLLYFWMYQPRASTALVKLLETISEDEHEIFITSQLVLERDREICQLMIDGILGKDFAKALAFYLSRSTEYLRFIKDLAA